MRELIVIAHNMRSTFNVGSLLRTADGLGISKVYLTGYTPYPATPNDVRLPHIADKLHAQIHKTALGAEASVVWEYLEDPTLLINALSDKGFTVAALEQSDKAIELTQYNKPDKIALLLGEEVLGIPKEILDQVQDHIVIPMHGKKESFNVVIAAAIALYELQFHS